jgi:AraC-like DNA-binding protein
MPVHHETNLRTLPLVSESERLPMAEQHESPRAHVSLLRALPNVRELAVGAEDVDINMVSLVVAKAVVAAAGELGVAVQVPELEAADQGGLDDPAHAMPRHAFVGLLQTIAQKLGDPATGVRLGSMMRADHLHFVGPLIMSSLTLRQAFERFLLVRRLVLGGPAWRAINDEHDARLCHAVDLRAPGAQLEAQFTATFAHRLTTEFLGARNRDSVRVEFAFPAPAYHEHISAFFGAPVRFGSDWNGVVLPVQAIGKLRNGSDAAFADAMERFARQRFLITNSRSTWSNRVRQMLLVSRAPAEVELDALAASWRISARSARRRLELEQTTFKAIREKVCMEMAASLISLHGENSIVVAERLGYREVNSFRRAFKRWFGSTPSAYRVHARDKDRDFPTSVASFAEEE